MKHHFHNWVTRFTFLVGAVIDHSEILGSPLAQVVDVHRCIRAKQLMSDLFVRNAHYNSCVLIWYNEILHCYVLNTGLNVGQALKFETCITFHVNSTGTKRIYRCISAKHTQAHKQTDKRTNRQAGAQIDRRTNRRTLRQTTALTNRHSQTYKPARRHALTTDTISHTPRHSHKHRSKHA